MTPPRIPPHSTRPHLRVVEQPLHLVPHRPAAVDYASTSLREVSDEVVLLGPDGSPMGTADRVAVHGADTPLHLAFSVYLFDEQGRLLMTRRALTKKTWAGVWSNSCCGHPRPGEDVSDAVKRRTGEEIGLTIDGLTCVVPDFAYRAVDASGIVEHENCPVYVGRTRGQPVLDPAEVMDAAWAPLADVRAAAVQAPFAFSPWSVLQLALLDPIRVQKAFA